MATLSRRLTVTISETGRDDIELVYRADGGIELRDGVDTERWIAADSPAEVRR